MAFAPRDRAALDAQRAAEQHDQNLLLMYAALLIAATMLILCIAMLAAEARPMPPKPDNTCKQTVSWAEWHALMKQYPEDQGLRALYELRVELCEKVDAGEMTMAEGTERFEQARRARMQRADKDKETGQSPR
jgi:hypothetical protein